jgi:hypothetical protein
VERENMIVIVKENVENLRESGEGLLGGISIEFISSSIVNQDMSRCESCTCLIDNENKCQGCSQLMYNCDCSGACRRYELRAGGRRRVD